MILHLFGGKDREEMSRLIDAEKCPCILCEDTRNAHCTYEHRSCEKFCNWLNNTVYNTEKVIAELEEKQYAYIHDNGDYEEGKYYAFEEAIDIVKKGGVE